MVMLGANCLSRAEFRNIWKHQSLLTFENGNFKKKHFPIKIPLIKGFFLACWQIGDIFGNGINVFFLRKFEAEFSHF